MNGNFGIQNGFFTSWAESPAKDSTPIPPATLHYGEAPRVIEAREQVLSSAYAYNIADSDGVPLKPQPNKANWTPGTMHIHDLNATMLHLLGIDHKRLTYRYQGRDFRLADVHGHVIRDLVV